MLSHRFTEALIYATNFHVEQVRKGSGVPYIAYLLGVASIALEYGANEDEAIAALLHDALRRSRICFEYVVLSTDAVRNTHSLINRSVHRVVKSNIA